KNKPQHEISILYLLLLGLSQSLPSAAASIATLYATHYSTGSVYSLSLDRATNGSYSLSIASSLKTCGPYPSWVTFDAATRTLYCSDENGGRSTNGSLTALAAPQGDGMLAELARTDAAPGGGVNSVIYEDGRGGKYLAIAHYAGSALSTFSLPISSSSSSAAAADPLQVFPFQLSSSPGTVPDRQEAPHPHQTLLDPTGAYVLVPDLGADLVRVFAIDKQSGQLTSCPSLPYTPGGGPRHGVFAAGGPVSRVKGHKPPPAEGQTILYVAGELNKEVEAFVSLTPYPDPGLPAGASLAEIRLVRDHVYVSVRLDGAFPPDDSVATLNRHRNGTLRLDEITSSYGVMPRTMAVNKAGNLVAVGNQLSSTVAIVPRDVVTGKLGEALAVLQVGVPGQPDTMEGLSSVIWAE
ncbi:hypothetical protein AOCH_006897, partial [Aspergillus ochraceoroseus]